MHEKKRFDIILITDFYPGFAESEIKTFEANGMTVLIAFQEYETGKTIPSNFNLLQLNSTVTSFHLLQVLKRIDVLSKIDWRLIFTRQGFRKIKDALYWLKLGLHYVNQIEAKCILDSEVKIYSYWGDQKAIAGCLLAKSYKSNLFVRFHRYDLYAERQETGFLPFRKWIYEESTQLLFISEHGIRYATEKNPEFGHKMCLSYLGVETDFKFNTPTTESKILKVVSCSYIVPVKRLSHIYMAISDLIKEGFEIHWTHFGGGAELFDFKQKIIDDNFSNNIDFRGDVKNELISNEYRKGGFDLFLNYSLSEGLPVSIMEAMACGIPCIAPNIAGIPEIIEDKINGFLIKDLNDKSEFKNLIISFGNLSSELKRSMSKKARNKVEQFFDKGKNAQEVLRLLKN